MKKLILLIVVCTSIVACKKSADSSDPGLPLNTFTFGGINYTATEYLPNNNIPFWGTGNGQGCAIYFRFRDPSRPAGIYRVSYNGDTSMNTVVVVFRKRPSINGYDDYASTGNDHKELEVNYEGGRMFIRLPKVWAKLPTAPQDSVEISAYLKEYL